MLQVMADLLDMAAKMLVHGGRLVYLLPTTFEFCEEDLPQHPCLRVIANSEDKLTGTLSRRLITMEKFCEYDSSQSAYYREVAETAAERGKQSYNNVLHRIQQMRLSSADEGESQRSSDTGDSPSVAHSKKRKPKRVSPNDRTSGDIAQRPIGNVPFDKIERFYLGDRHAAWSLYDHGIRVQFPTGSSTERAEVAPTE